ncbi:MAG: hypothetical protein QM765_23575 [Myxococcales bacterium]
MAESFGSKILGTFFERKEAPKSDEEATKEALETNGKSPSELMDELVKASDPTASPAASAPAATAPVPAPAVSGPKVTHFPAIGSGASVPAAPNPMPAPAATPEAPEPPKVAPANINFEAIFRDAGMDVMELDRVKKAEELLKNLPPETPLALQKTIVETSLKAFGIELAKIVTASQNQKKAIDTYVKVNDAASQKAVQEAEAQIKSLTDKIAALKADIEKRQLGHAGLVAAAQLRKGQIEKILEFFEPPKPG